MIRRCVTPRRASPAGHAASRSCAPARNSEDIEAFGGELVGRPKMKRFVTIGAVAGLAMLPELLMAQTAPAGRGNAGTTRRSFEKFTVEGQPIDKRPPELDTDHPVFPGQTHAPYHKTTDVAVTTIASGLDNPWAVALLPSGRFLITEKPGRLRILNKDGSPLHTITTNMPPV